VQGVELALGRSDEDRGRHVQLARPRVCEVPSTATDGPAGSLVGTLDDMEAETRADVRLLSDTVPGPLDGELGGAVRSRPAGRDRQPARVS